MANYNITNTEVLDASGTAAERKFTATISAYPTLPDDQYTFELVYYDDYGEEISIDGPHTYTTSGDYSIGPPSIGFSAADLRAFINDRYERDLFVIVTSLNNGDLYNSVKVIDSAYAAPTFSITPAYTDAVTVDDETYPVQGKSTASITFTATAGQFPIEGYRAYFGGTTPSESASSPVTVSAPVGFGATILNYGVYAGKKLFTAQDAVDVLAYEEPTVVKAAGENAIVCMRSDDQGNYSATGTYLTIICDKKYSSLEVGDVKRNTAILEAAISENGGAYGAWFTVSGTLDSDTVAYTSATALLSTLTSAYSIKLRITDGLNTATTIMAAVSAANIPLHLAAGGRAVGIGQYASSDNDVVDFGWKARFNVGIAGRTVYSGTAKTYNQKITSDEGDFGNIDKYRVFFVINSSSSYLMLREDTADGFNFVRTDGSPIYMEYDSQNNEITVTFNGASITSITALI